MLPIQACIGYPLPNSSGARTSRTRLLFVVTPAWFNQMRQYRLPPMQSGVISFPVNRDVLRNFSDLDHHVVDVARPVSLFLDNSCGWFWRRPSDFMLE